MEAIKFRSCFGAGFGRGGGNGLNDEALFLLELLCEPAGGEKRLRTLVLLALALLLSWAIPGRLRALLFHEGRETDEEAAEPLGLFVFAPESEEAGRGGGSSDAAYFFLLLAADSSIIDDAIVFLFLRLGS